MMSYVAEAVQPMQVRCQNCRTPITVDEPGTFCRIECSSCGSSFNLVDETVVYDRSQERKIGPFEIVEELGIGSFGSVYKARDPELDRLVAIKVPLRGQLDAHDAELFLREARAAARLKHPNIVPVHEVGRQDGSVYIVSDFVEGMTLADWLTGQLPTCEEAASLCATIARAAEHAHSAGVIHRDLKPGNILLDRDGTPHITDFGLARRETGDATITIDGKIIGTAAYMSPEQARGEAHVADRRSDVYSLGVILFELLTGEKPFRGNTRMMLHQVLNVEPPSPRSLNNQVPRDLETVCLKCLQKEPDRRYATAGALAADLDAFLAGAPIQARPVPAWERSLKWMRRHPSAAGLVVASGIALLAVTSLAVGYPLYQEVVVQRSIAQQKEKEAQRQAQSAEHFQYVARILLAVSYWNEGRQESARSVLFGCPVTQRGWEWHYLYRLFHEQESHEPAVRSVAGDDPADSVVVADAAGDVVVRGHATGMVSLFDRTGEAVTILDQLAVPPTAAIVSADGTHAAMATVESDRGGMPESEVSVLALAERRVTRLPAKGWEVTCLSLNSDATMLAAGCAHPADGNGAILIWTRDVAAAWLPHPGPVMAAGPVKDVVLSPVGHSFAALVGGGPGKSDALLICEAGNGRVLQNPRLDLGLEESPMTFQIPRAPSDHDKPIIRGNVLCFSPDGSRVLVGEETGISCWAMAHEDISQFLQCRAGSIQDVEFNTSGSRIAAITDIGDVLVWDWNPTAEVSQPSRTGRFHHRRKMNQPLNHEPLTLLKSPAGMCIGFSADQNWILCADTAGGVHLWNGVPLFAPPSSGGPTSAPSDPE